MCSSKKLCFTWGQVERTLVQKSEKCIRTSFSSLILDVKKVKTLSGFGYMLTTDTLQMYAYSTCNPVLQSANPNFMENIRKMYF